MPCPPIGGMMTMRERVALLQTRQRSGNKLFRFLTPQSTEEISVAAL